MANTRVQDDSMDRVAVSKGSVEALQNKDTNAFASSIASATIIKCVASSVFVYKRAK